MTERKTVLIVEDDRDARFVLSAILNHDGYRVIEAVNGEEGVALAAAELPDVIVMDLRMPIMNGMQAAEAIHADARSRHIPIVVLTAHDFEDWESPERAEVLFHSRLGKPIEPRRLMEHVRGIIGPP